MAGITKQDAQALLADVPPEFAFWVHDGGVLRNLRELNESLVIMSDETYGYHSNDFKKDFGNWVRDIIGDKKLASDLDKAASRAEAARAVSRRLKFLEGKLKA